MGSKRVCLRKDPKNINRITSNACGDVRGDPIQSSAGKGNTNTSK